MSTFWTSINVSVDGKTCLKCGQPVFHAVPGRTTQQDIIAFVSRTNWPNKETYLRDHWIHPGVYCAQCPDVGGLFEYRRPTPPFRDEGNRARAAIRFRATLISAGANRKRLIVRVHERLRCSLAAARSLVDRAPSSLFAGAERDVADLKFELERLGAAVEVSAEPEDSQQ